MSSWTSRRRLPPGRACAGEARSASDVIDSCRELRVAFGVTSGPQLPPLTPTTPSRPPARCPHAHTARLGIKCVLPGARRAIGYARRLLSAPSYVDPHDRVGAAILPAHVIPLAFGVDEKVDRTGSSMALK